MKTLLEGLLPRMFPALEFLCLAHEGKNDLARSLPRKLKAWALPDDRFVVLRDNDRADCNALKASLVGVCQSAGRPDTLVRLVCQELEAWYFGQPNSLATSLGNETLRGIGARARYRHPDAILHPSRELARLCPGFQKISTARTMANHLSYRNNRSPSFRALIHGIARLSGQPLPA